MIRTVATVGGATTSNAFAKFINSWQGPLGRDELHRQQSSWFILAAAGSFGGL